MNLHMSMVHASQSEKDMLMSSTGKFRAAGLECANQDTSSFRIRISLPTSCDALQCSFAKTRACKYIYDQIGHIVYHMTNTSSLQTTSSKSTSLLYTFKLFPHVVLLTFPSSFQDLVPQPSRTHRAPAGRRSAKRGERLDSTPNGQEMEGWSVSPDATDPNLRRGAGPDSSGGVRGTNHLGFSERRRSVGAIDVEPKPRLRFRRCHSMGV